jgi:hypothetical protein
LKDYGGFGLLTFESLRSGGSDRRDLVFGYEQIEITFFEIAFDLNQPINKVVVCENRNVGGEWFIVHDSSILDIGS